MVHLPESNLPVVSVQSAGGKSLNPVRKLELGMYMVEVVVDRKWISLMILMGKGAVVAAEK